MSTRAPASTMSSPSAQTFKTRPPAAASGLGRPWRFRAGALGLASLIPLGGLIKNPWAEGPDSPLWHSGWSPIYNPADQPNETVFLRRDTGIVGKKLQR